jgi:transmembrane sensor
MTTDDDGTDERIARAVRGDASDIERFELAAWRRAAPEHDRRYRRIERLVAAARGLAAGTATVPPRPTAAAIIAAAAGHGRARRRLPAWSAWLIAAAAVAILAVNVRWFPRVDTWTPSEVVTGADELATVKLADGSVVRLGPSSRLYVEGGPAREVRLEGRAFFAIAHDRGRPFRVRTSVATANVLGTRFELATAGAAALHLKVIEGRVALETPGNVVEVGAGEESGVRGGAATAPLPLAAPLSADGWLGRFMAFQATPLREVAREIERLYDTRVAITDAALADATLTATFTDSALADVMAIVCDVLGARCAPTEDGFTIGR